MKALVIALILCCQAFNMQAQKSINDYKYVVVPLQYDFLKGQNQYRLNTLTKFLFEEKNFNVYYANTNLPEDLFKNRCLAMYADVQKVKVGFLSNSVEVILKDCKGNLILKSRPGSSKEKKFKDAFNIALRAAFKTLKVSDYDYQPKKDNDDLKKEVKALVVVEDVSKVVSNQIKSSETKTETEKVNLEIEVEKTYYAQSIPNGFQLVDATPKIIMILLTTDVADVYLVKDSNAMVFNENGQWVYFENNGNTTKRELLNIKF